VEALVGSTGHNYAGSADAPGHIVPSLVTQRWLCPNEIWLISYLRFFFVVHICTRTALSVGHAGTDTHEESIVLYKEDVIYSIEHPTPQTTHCTYGPIEGPVKRHIHAFSTKM
jgi:hypothetical protein